MLAGDRSPLVFAMSVFIPGLMFRTSIKGSLFAGETTLVCDGYLMFSRAALFFSPYSLANNYFLAAMDSNFECSIVVLCFKSSFICLLIFHCYTGF